jgi:hypothetical protein
MPFKLIRHLKTRLDELQQMPGVSCVDDLVQRIAAAPATGPFALYDKESHAMIDIAEVDVCPDAAISKEAGDVLSEYWNPPDWTTKKDVPLALKFGVCFPN